MMRCHRAGEFEFCVDKVTVARGDGRTLHYEPRRISHRKWLDGEVLSVETLDPLCVLKSGPRVEYVALPQVCDPFTGQPALKGAQSAAEPRASERE